MLADTTWPRSDLGAGQICGEAGQIVLVSISITGCDGWGHTTRAQCQTYCETNTVPPGCASAHGTTTCGAFRWTAPHVFRGFHSNNGVTGRGKHHNGWCHLYKHCTPSRGIPGNATFYTRPGVSFKLSTLHYTWNQAKEYCLGQGGILATVHSSAEWKLALYAARSARCGTNCSSIYGDTSACAWFWLGATKSSSTWNWLDDNTTIGKYIDLDANGDGSTLAGWITSKQCISGGGCHGKSECFQDAPENWRFQALCRWKR